MTPLLSVIVPFYNRAGFVGAAISSIGHVATPDVEVIAVDDGSTDGSADAIDVRTGSFRLIRQENAGPGAARNCGIRAARGRYVAFLDSDDLWFPWSLQMLRRAIAQNDNPSCVAMGNIFFRNQRDTTSIVQSPYVAKRHGDLLEFFGTQPGVCFPTGSMTIRADVLAAAGGFTNRRINSEDTDLWLRIGTAPGFVRIVEPPGFAQRQHDDNVSNEVSRSIEGMRYILQQERAGAYPGRSIRAFDRAALIGFMGRTISVQSLNAKRHIAAWLIYIELLRIHLKTRRFRYLIAFPILAIVRLVKRDAQQIT